MLKTQPLSQCLELPTEPQAPCIVGQFSLGKAHCLAITLDKTLSGSAIEITLRTFLATFNISEFAEVFRFVAKTHHCIIVQTDHPPVDPTQDLPAHLTARELQIATLVAQGKPNKQIAKQLQISEWTVATYLRRIFVKLGALPWSIAALLY